MEGLRILRKLKRGVITLLTLLLIFIPYSVLAQTNSKEITYVAIGDSLTAGMLSDRTIGEGFVGKITKQLESSGYDVTTYNFGVPGAKTDDVLRSLTTTNALPDEADLVTISVGANDLVLGVDLNDLVALMENMKQKKYETSGDVEIFKMQYAELISLLNELEHVKDELKQFIDTKRNEISDDEFTQLNNYYSFFMENVDALKNKLSSLDLEKDQIDVNFQSENYVALQGNLQTILDQLTIVNGIIVKLIDQLTNVNFSPISEILDEVMLSKLENMYEKLLNSSIVPGILQYNIDGLNSKVIRLIDFQSEIQNIFAQLTNLIMHVGVKMPQIIQAVQQKYPEAKIYVMGYYNALPYLPSDIQTETLKMISGLNDVIKTATNATGVTYISTFEKFVDNYASYLPNPDDIHPSDAGYEAIAAAFLEEINKAFPTITDEPVSEKEVEVTLGQTISVYPGQIINIAGTNVQLVLPNSLTPGTTLTITPTSKDALAKAKNLKAVGAVLHFAFQFPNGAPVNQIFTLTFSYDHDTDDIAVYHFNEAKEQWEKVTGVVNPAKKEVTVQVNHFSSYGVFTEVAAVDDTTNDGNPNGDADDETTVVVVDGGDAGVRDVDTSHTANNARSDDGEEVSSSAATLPKTAANIFNYMLLGAVMFSLGIILYGIEQKRKKKQLS